MNSTFYVVSIGPGDPELITMQAIKVLLESDIVFVPNRSPNSEWKGSVSYNILCKLNIKLPDMISGNKEQLYTFMNRLKPIYTPMNYSSEAWNDQAYEIAQACKNYAKVAYVTLGDAAISSSAYYLLDIMKNKYEDIYESSVIIPGISSFSLASSLVKKPLSIGNTDLEIINLNTTYAEKTKVFMRPQKGQDLSKFKGNDVYFFQNLGLNNEFFGKDIPEKADNYLSLIVDFASNNTSSLTSQGD